MLQKVVVQGNKTVVNDKLRTYVTKKIGKLDKYLSKHSRESVHAVVRLKETKTKDAKHCICEVTLHLPQQTIQIQESALNMYAAVDIVAVKLKQQICRYKDLHENAKTRRHVFARFRRQTA